MKDSKLQPIVQKLKQSLIALYQDKLEAIILYGSQARGDANEFSDIDILVILKDPVNPYKEIDNTSQIIYEICRDYDVLISRHFISGKNFKTTNTPFISNVKKEGIHL